MTKKYDLGNAVHILSWLTDMCAPSPGATIGSKFTDAERIAWLERAEERPWLPADFGTTREGWQLAAAGFIELEHCGPSVLKVRRGKTSVTCFPHIRLSDLGARWCRLCLASHGKQVDPSVDADFFGQLVAQAMERPDDVAALRKQLVRMVTQHGLSCATLLGGMQGRADLVFDDVQWHRSPLFDWAALVLVGKGVHPSADAKPEAITTLLRGVPS